MDSMPDSAYKFRHEPTTLLMSDPGKATLPDWVKQMRTPSVEIKNFSGPVFWHIDPNLKALRIDGRHLQQIITNPHAKVTILPGSGLRHIDVVRMSPDIQLLNTGAPSNYSHVAVEPRPTDRFIMPNGTVKYSDPEFSQQDITCSENASFLDGSDNAFRQNVGQNPRRAGEGYVNHIRANYATPRQIQQQVKKPFIGGDCEKWLMRGKNSSVVEHEKLGQFMSDQFQMMDKTGDKSYLFMTRNHMMNLGLSKFLDKQGKVVYQAFMGDSNRPAKPIGREAGLLSEVRDWQTKNFIYPKFMTSYYMAKEGHEVPASYIVETPRGPGRSTIISESATAKSPSARVNNYPGKSGRFGDASLFYANFRQANPQESMPYLTELPNEEAARLLSKPPQFLRKGVAAKNSQMVNYHFQLIRELQQLGKLNGSQVAQAALGLAPKTNGSSLPAIVGAIESGDVDSIQAYSDGIKSLIEKRLIPPSELKMTLILLNACSKIAIAECLRGNEPDKIRAVNEFQTLIASLRVATAT
ncbi:MAG: hypothetical protein JWP52_4662 [Rhizobacter sp.]|nr:hypothetical protein [Rhizobacter sp.]